VFSAPNEQLAQIDQILGEFGASGTWRVQPLEISGYQLKAEIAFSPLQAAELVSLLARTKSIFELEFNTLPSERYLHHPALGICRQELDEAGEQLIRAGVIENLLMETAGNLSEFSRGFRRLTGVAWMDLIEPYRKSAEYLIALPRAV
jgi:hypothetical protein